MADDANQRHSLERIHQQARIYKLVREERIIGVGKESSAFDGPRRRVNLVVEGQERSAGNLRLCRAIKGINGEPGPGVQAAFNLAQTVFRYGENYGDGFELRNDGKGCASIRLHHVARSTSRKPTRPEMGAVMWQYST